MEYAGIRPYAAAGVAIWAPASSESCWSSGPRYPTSIRSRARWNLYQLPKHSTFWPIHWTRPHVGNPTVNVADTLATDFVADLGVGNEVGTIDGDLDAGFALLDTDFGNLGTALTTGLDTLGTALGKFLAGDFSEAGPGAEVSPLCRTNNPIDRMRSGFVWHMGNDLLFLA